MPLLASMTENSLFPLVVSIKGRREVEALMAMTHLASSFVRQSWPPNFTTAHPLLSHLSVMIWLTTLADKYCKRVMIAK